jgi:hypothetical protein
MMEYVRIAAITLALGASLGCAAASAQSVRPTKPGEIAIMSKLMAAKYEDCRQQANQQHLHLLKRHNFLKQCRAAP